METCKMRQKAQSENAFSNRNFEMRIVCPVSVFAKDILQHRAKNLQRMRISMLAERADIFRMTPAPDAEGGSAML